MLPLTGTYFVTASETQTNETGNYRLHLEKISPDLAQVELGFGDAVHVDELNPGTDIDQFSFEARAGSEIRFELSTATNGLDPVLEIRDPAGDMFFVGSCVGSCGIFNDPCKCDIIGGTVMNPLEPMVNGTYHGILHESGLNESGSYTTSLQCLFPFPTRQDPFPCPEPSPAMLSGAALASLAFLRSRRLRNEEGRRPAAIG